MRNDRLLAAVEELKSKVPHDWELYSSMTGSIKGNIRFTNSARKLLRQLEALGNKYASVPLWEITKAAERYFQHYHQKLGPELRNLGSQDTEPRENTRYWGIKVLQEIGCGDLGHIIWDHTW